MLADHPVQVGVLDLALAMHDDRGRMRVEGDQRHPVLVMVVELGLHLPAVDLHVPVFHHLSRPAFRDQAQLLQPVGHGVVEMIGRGVQDLQVHRVVCLTEESVVLFDLSAKPRDVGQEVGDELVQPVLEDALDRHRLEPRGQHVDMVMAGT
jgi:hypothetical protein